MAGMSYQAAEAAVRRGARIGFIIAGLSLFVNGIGLVGAISNSESLLDPISGLVIALILGCLSLGLLKGSRLAAVSLILLVVLSRISFLLEMDGFQVPGLVGIASLLIGLVFLFIFIQAARGAFVIQRHRREEESVPRTAFIPWWGYVLMAPFGLLGLGVLALMVIVLQAPPDRVLSGSEVSEKYLTVLRENDILEDDEKVSLFYSGGLFDILEDGNLVTDRRVISYETLDDDFFLYTLAFEDIGNVEITEKGDAFSDSWILIADHDDEESFHLLATTEGRGDLRFVREIRQRIERARRNTPAEPSSSTGAEPVEEPGEGETPELEAEEPEAAVPESPVPEAAESEAPEEVREAGG